jgi:Ulp1 family protease
MVEFSRTTNLISTLSTEWEETINEQMAVKNPQHSVVTAANGVDLKRYDFGRLLPQKGTKDPDNGWLNDNIVNAFMSTIVASKKEQTGWKTGDGAPAFEAYDSTWYVKYEESGINAISRWSTRKKIKGRNLLKCDKIFFPASKNKHWTLLIISPKARKIEYLDSLRGGGNRKLFFRIAREWLAMELGIQYDASEWTEEDLESQMQHNGDDCGVFTCFNALASAKDKNFQFVDGYRMYEARRLAAAILMKGRLAEEFEL